MQKFDSLEEKSSETLAALVATYRILGSNKEDSIKAMEILSTRKDAGDEFDFNKYISEIVNKAQKSTLKNNSQFSSLFNQSNLETVIKNLMVRNSDKDEFE